MHVVNEGRRNLNPSFTYQSMLHCANSSQQSEHRRMTALTDQLGNLAAGNSALEAPNNA